MIKRRLLRIFIVTAFLTVAIPLYLRLLAPQSAVEGPTPFTVACHLWLAPGISTAQAVLPVEYLYMTPSEGYAHRDLVLWAIALPANVLLWTTALALISFAIDRVRRRT
jgi:hypothetical protein